MSKLRILLGIALVLGLAGANAWQYWLKPNPVAPNLTMTTIDDQVLNLQSLQGKPVLISFWATGCGACLSEIDALIALHQAYHDKGYTTIAVALSYDSLEQVESMAKNKPLPYFVAFDRQGDYARAFGGVKMTPTHFLISPEGRIIWNNVGPINRKALQARITPLLEETV